MPEIITEYIKAHLLDLNRKTKYGAPFIQIEQGVATILESKQFF